VDYLLSVAQAVQQIREQRERERARLEYGSEPVEYDQEWRQAAERFPNRECQFLRSTIEACISCDARDLGNYYKGVRRLTASWVPEMEMMHEIFDYSE